jgi:hypothetical protein
VAVSALSHPATLATLEELSKGRYQLNIYMCSKESLVHAWNRYADLIKTNAAKKGVFDIDADEIIAFAKQIKSKVDLSSKLNSVNTINNARRVTETLELIFAGALGLKPLTSTSSQKKMPFVFVTV